MKLIFVFLCFFGQLPSLLPPFAQSVRELNAIFSDSRLTMLNSASPIQQVVRVEEGYLVETRDQRLLVRVEYLPTQRIGPAPFQLDFQMVKRARALQCQ